MKKRLEHEDDQELEILKAVAQAWHSRSTCSKTANEFDAHRQNFKTKPSRFKLEAMNKLSGIRSAGANWDFRQSLWDSYEIVTVAKRLETGLVLDEPLTGAEPSRVHRRRRESKSNLRNLFNRSSSRRFSEDEVARADNTQF